MSAHVEKYLIRIDAHLQTIGGAHARRRFLERQLRGWEVRYANFMMRDDDEPITADQPTASDYLLTICGLASRLR
jgi:hypothetical protein